MREARRLWIKDSHALLMRCLNPECLFIFFEEEDEEFLTL